jgi:hypothetical protein
MKLLRPLAGYTLYDNKTNDSVSRELQTMHTRRDRWIQTELVFTLAKNITKPNPFEIISLQTTKKNSWKTEEVGESSCNSGDGTDQRVQSLMFIMMVMMMIYLLTLSACWSVERSAGCYGVLWIVKWKGWERKRPWTCSCLHWLRKISVCVFVAYIKHCALLAFELTAYLSWLFSNEFVFSKKYSHLPQFFAVEKN